MNSNLKNNKDENRQILKIASIFGSIQVLNIIFSIVRSKAAVLFLGATGMGILGLYNSIVDFITQVSKMGVDVTVVKEISHSEYNEDAKKTNLTLYISRKLILLTGVIGAILLCVLAPFLSELTFGTREHQWSIMLLSMVIVFRQIQTGNLAILQGLRKYKVLSKVNIYIAILTTIISVTLYWLLKIKSIVYVIILSSIIGSIISYRYIFFNVKIEGGNKLSVLEFLHRSKKMISMGLSLSFVGIMSLAGAYFIRVYLRTYADINYVGYYQASFVILNTYIGLVFNSLRTDYFPRLSAIHNVESKLNKVVNQQAKITLLLVTPLVSFFIVLSSYILKLLYTSEFLVIKNLLVWSMLGVVFKAASFSLGYVLLAKNDSNIFLKTTVFFNILLLVMSILGYQLYGLDGMGIAYCIYFFIHLLILKVIVGKQYNLKLQNDFYSILFICVILVLGLCLSVTFLSNMYRFISLIILMTIVTAFCFNKLDTLVDLKEKLNSFKWKK